MVTPNLYIYTNINVRKCQVFTRIALRIFSIKRPTKFALNANLVGGYQCDLLRSIKTGDN